MEFLPGYHSAEPVLRIRWRADLFERATSDDRNSGRRPQCAQRLSSLAKSAEAQVFQRGVVLGLRPRHHKPAVIRSRVRRTRYGRREPTKALVRVGLGGRQRFAQIET